MISIFSRFVGTVAAIATAIICTLGCGDAPTGVEDPLIAAPVIDPALYDAPVPMTISVFIQGNQDMVTEDMVLQAIDFWSRVGLSATFTATYEEADVKILVDEEDATVDDFRGCKAAETWLVSKKVAFYPNCLELMWGGYSIDRVQPASVDVLAHEIGHALGVRHVPSNCAVVDDVNPIYVHANGTEICGPQALMNPYNRVIHSGVSLMDIYAFETRVPL